jgi:CHASE2 domain-containing sensor protein
MKVLPSWMRSWALDIAIHAVAWAAILVAIYFSFIYGQWWPVAIVLIAVLLVDGLLLFRRARRKARFVTQTSGQTSTDQ